MRLRASRPAAGTAWPSGAGSGPRFTSPIAIGRLVVSCDPSGTDRYGRTLAICSEGGEDLNALMVSDGMAVAYRAFSSRYLDEEAAARGAGLGIWATEFEMPWDWRKK